MNPDTPALRTENNTVEKQKEKLIQNLELVRDGTTNTAKFVGLYLFQWNLQDMPDLVQDWDFMAKCWRYIPANFLDRLFVATQFKGEDPEHIIDRNIVIDLAVSTIYTFAIFLPAEQVGYPKISKRIPGLLAALNVQPMLPEDVTYEILQVLQMYAITPLGASFMLDGQSRAILIQAAKQDQAAFKILRRAFIVEVHRGQSARMLSRFHDTMSRLIDAFRDVPEMTAFFAGAFDLLVVIQPPELRNPPPWLGEMARILRESSIKRKGRDAATFLVGVLQHKYPMHFPPILFDSDACAIYNKKEPISLSWRFTQLRAVDIRITLTSIKEKVDTPGYQSIKHRLTASYYIIAGFINSRKWRVSRNSLERAEDVQTPVPFTDDVVLKIRDEMSNLCQKTMEYLCDRYDDGLAAKSGYSDPTLPSTISDDNKSAWLMSHEPHVIASVTLLALWLQQDASARLHDEVADMMDITLKLYEPNPALRVLLIIIVHQSLRATYGMENFALHRGWEILFHDLKSIVVPDQTPAGGGGKPPPDDATANRGMHLLRLLAEVAKYGLGHHERLKRTRHAGRWNEILELASSLNCEGAAALWDLKIALLDSMSTLVDLAAEVGVITVEAKRVKELVKG
ncbi:MAG: hypothetical protein Q9228_007443, partial [Teloschistes exilis]